MSYELNKKYWFESKDLKKLGILPKLLKRGEAYKTFVSSVLISNNYDCFTCICFNHVNLTTQM